ncbi:uracil-DNA glycosylase family protein [Pseudooctadecabacter jejudonensis]|uniref:Uracil DNA glycosylase superfamily protein n=1 Tax=Pseudooctadecabacter jejudonensis TaxID=1391910 RepID=A0A1Y5SU94_9RHOB|nr:uracil-DNA glycosylase family protein [Pseudooctadecabacter jejudonensis]SLN47065.1 Uracil DNA glycosylase superfamily protein [Pseudooctadecabacter jejudonensis]
MSLPDDIRACRICAERFALTRTQHRPKPIVWFRPTARVLIASQAPGARAHAGQRPFMDPSGDRLRDWMGVDETAFYDQSKIAIVPMAFCFPGYDKNGSDIPPPKVCGDTWHHRIFPTLPNIRLRLIIGASSMRYHLKTRAPVTEVVRGWRDHAPHTFVLPHPSWRNTAWLKKHPWFTDDVLPALQARVKEVLND